MMILLYMMHSDADSFAQNNLDEAAAEHGWGGEQFSS